MSTRMCRFFALDLLARIVTVRINAGSPFFGAFHALAVDDGSGGTGFPLRLFATPLIKRMVDPCQCAVIGPQIEVVVKRALGGRSFGTARH